MDLNLLNVIKISHLISFHISFLLHTYIYIYIIISRETNKLIILVYTSISKFQFFSPILLFLNHSTYKLFYRERERERDGLFLLKRKKKKEEELCKMRWQDLVEEGRIETLVGIDEKSHEKKLYLLLYHCWKKLDETARMDHHPTGDTDFTFSFGARCARVIETINQTPEKRRVVGTNAATNCRGTFSHTRTRARIRFIDATPPPSPITALNVAFVSSFKFPFLLPSI